MKKAFTLIELIATIAISAIMIAYIPIGFARATQHIQLDIAAKNTVDILNQLRQNAMTYSTQTSLKAEGGILTVNKNLGHGEISSADLKIDLPKGIYIDPPITFKFAASGFPVTGYSGTAHIKGFFEKSKKIIVSSYGRIRIE